MDCAYIINIGDIEYSRITIPLIQDYCNKYNIELHTITENLNNYTYPHWCKLDVLKKFLNSNYNRCLYMDIDIIIKNNSPNIFDYYKGGLNIVSDLHHNNNFWTEHKMYPYLKDYYNMGVFIIDRKTAYKIYNHSINFHINSLMHLKSFEQPYFNIWIDQLNISIQKMSNVWNICSKFLDNRRFFFVHYSTSDEKKNITR